MSLLHTPPDSKGKKELNTSYTEKSPKTIIMVGLVGVRNASTVIDYFSEEKQSSPA